MFIGVKMNWKKLYDKLCLEQRLSNSVYPIYDFKKFMEENKK